MGAMNLDFYVDLEPSNTWGKQTVNTMKVEKLSVCVFSFAEKESIEDTSHAGICFGFIV